MIHRIVPSTIWALLISEAAIVFTAHVAATYLLMDVDPWLWLFYDDGFLRISAIVLWMVLGLYFQDLYSNFRIRSRFVLVQQVSLALGSTFLFQALVSYIAPRLLLPRWIMMVGSLLVLVLLPLWRLAYSHLVLQTLATEQTLFLGASPMAQQIAKRMEEHTELGCRVLGFLAEEAELAGLPEPWRLGRFDQLREMVDRLKPDRVVVGLTERRQRMPVQDLLSVSFGGTRVEEAATTYEGVLQRVSTLQLRPSQLIFSRELGPRPSRLKLQLVYSTFLAAIGLIVAGPVMLLVAALVKLTSPGPAVYSQRRTGLHGKPFMVYKFRSMRVDAEAKTGAVWASKDDPRITRFGKIIRKTRLDELPQLFNVLRGDMSLVGPRPERPEFVTLLAEKIPFFPHRHCVRPGITGWAQINHKYGDTLEDTVTKLEYDLYYIKNLSPMLDFFIMFQTVKVMLLSRGSQ
ncbi:MAG: sugar transferase [Bryobacterales bacterium]|nr:sugar transferase [Bryobacterales bacterium]